MSFLKSDMRYDDGQYYTWTARSSNDDPKTIGGKEKDELNRREGYEVLPFIQNWVRLNFNRPTLSVYHKIERLIRYNLPAEIKNQSEISIWLLNNYNRIL